MVALVSYPSAHVRTGAVPVRRSLRGGPLTHPQRVRRRHHHVDGARRALHGAVERVRLAAGWHRGAHLCTRTTLVSVVGPATRLCRACVLGNRLVRHADVGCAAVHAFAGGARFGGRNQGRCAPAAAEEARACGTVLGRRRCRRRARLRGAPRALAGRWLHRSGQRSRRGALVADGGRRKRLHDDAELVAHSPTRVLCRAGVGGQQLFALAELARLGVDTTRTRRASGTLWARLLLARHMALGRVASGQRLRFAGAFVGRGPACFARQVRHRCDTRRWRGGLALGARTAGGWRSHARCALRSPMGPARRVGHLRRRSIGSLGRIEGAHALVRRRPDPRLRGTGRDPDGQARRATGTLVAASGDPLPRGGCCRRFCHRRARRWWPQDRHGRTPLGDTQLGRRGRRHGALAHKCRARAAVRALGAWRERRRLACPVGWTTDRLALGCSARKRSHQHRPHSRMA